MNKQENTSQKRLKKLITKCAIAIAIGILYYLLVKLLNFGIPCIFYLASGKYCPGCGISRMFMALIEGDPVAAFGHNALIFSLLPFGVVYGIKYAIKYVKHGSTEITSIVDKIFLIILFVLTVIFWILRNTSEFSWLAP